MRIETRRVSRRAFELFSWLVDATADELIVCRDLLNRRKAYYRWEIPKASGGKRTITSPVEELKAVQRRILERIFYPIPVHFIAHGFVRDRDIMTNAGRHKDARAVFNLDLKDAFPSVQRYRVMVNLEKPFRRLLRLQFGDAITDIQIKDIIWMTAKLCTYNGSLPQGAPTSPALLNLVCLHLDQELFGIAHGNSLVVTRYADDITFSTREDEIPGEIRQRIRATISNTGWKVNHKKTTYVTRANGRPLEVTGLLLQENGRVTIPSERRERYRTFLLQLLSKDQIEPSEREQAIGIIVYVSRVYQGFLPKPIEKVWLQCKKKFGIGNAPQPRVHKAPNGYAPDIKPFSEKGAV